MRKQFYINRKAVFPFPTVSFFSAYTVTVTAEMPVTVSTSSVNTRASIESRYFTKTDIGTRENGLCYTDKKRNIYKL